MLPSFFSSGDRPQSWNVARAAAYGASIGALAALFKTFAPFHDTIAVGARPTASVLAEIAGAALCFAVLCAAATIVRNYLTQRLV